VALDASPALPHPLDGAPGRSLLFAQLQAAFNRPPAVAAISRARWKGIRQLVWLDERPDLLKLRQALRLASAVIAKLSLCLRRTFSFDKKAVSERPFFVMHETHPPAQAVPDDGLFVGAFQAD